ncbi:YkvA family protein [Ramlibacter sp. MAHUQ-53]|uniref:YkvA family protein n=1 Tax=unclassified Ramlibacter TaxID=2617605 RepID=UPI003639D13D
MARWRDRTRTWARSVKRDGVSLWFALRDPRTPWPAKLLAGIVVAYALSPIDLVPDFIPVLGYLDDVILLPGLIWLTVRLIPDDVLADCRARAEAWMEARGRKPRWWLGAVLVVAVWVAVMVGLWRWLA